MATIQPSSAEAAFFMNEVQRELVTRGKAEEGDTTMAEYVLVMILNDKSAESIEAELRDLQGDEFDPSFTPWLFTRAEAIQSGRLRPPSATAAPIPTPSISFAPAPIPSYEAPQPIQTYSAPGPSRAINGNARLLSTALAPISSRGAAPSGPSNGLAGQKRGLSPAPSNEAYNKRRSLGNGAVVPMGPRGMRADEIEEDDVDMEITGEGRRSQGLQQQPRRLVDRLGGRPLNPNASEFGAQRGGGGHWRGGMAMRGGMRNGNFQQQQQPRPFPQQMMGGMMGMNPAFGGMPMGAGQDSIQMQEMFRQQQEQMAAMQYMMTQMVQAVQTGGQQMAPPARPPPPQPSQKLGNHIINATKPASSTSSKSRPSTTGPPPDKPLSPELCKFSVGCTNTRCTFSHPSPVATLESGMVLKTEVCPEGKGCKDKDCAYSHVSPAQTHGETSGTARVLCKFPVCTNPTCQFRHEDAEGNFIPPPALTRAQPSPKDSNAMDTGSDNGADDLDVTFDADTSSSGLASKAKIPLTSEQQEALMDRPLSEATAAQKPRGGGKNTGKQGKVMGKPNNGMIPVACKFGTGCTNQMCKFIHDGKIACSYGARCFKESCPYAHPPNRILPSSSSIPSSGFTTYKGDHKTSSMSDRKFQVSVPADEVEKLVPGGVNGTGKGKVGVDGSNGGGDTNSEAEAEEEIGRGEDRGERSGMGVKMEN